MENLSPKDLTLNWEIPSTTRPGKENLPANIIKISSINAGFKGNKYKKKLINFRDNTIKEYIPGEKNRLLFH